MTGSPIWALLLIAGTVLLIVVAGVLLVVRSPGARWKLGLAVLALALAAFLAAFRVDTVVEQPHSEVHQIARPVPMKRSDVGDAADGFPGRVHPSAARSEATTVAERDGASLLIRSGRIETRQDHADWQRDATAISFRSPSSESPAPEWVGNAAGASLREERVGDTTFRIWKPGPRGELAAYSTMEATAELAIDAARAEAADKLAVLALHELARRHEEDRRFGTSRPPKESRDRSSRRGRAAGPRTISNASSAGARRAPPGDDPPPRTRSTLPEDWPEPHILTPLAREIAEQAVPRLVREDHLEAASLNVRGDSALPPSSVDVWRAAVLVDASEPQIDELTAIIEVEVARGWVKEEARRRRLVTLVAGTAILAFLVFVVYAFANASTKGHFAWPLRLVCLAALIAGGIALWYMHARLGWLW
ncbi:MAG TPA: hypothetical protein VK116_02055 [Planctomycetota bacterium]|nr:hypothetical protein [Planctomycetota bacterium]